MKITEYPDRNFMWAIMSTLKPCSTQKLIEDAGKIRGIENEEITQLLFKIATEFYDKQKVIYIQKVR